MLRMALLKAVRQPSLSDTDGIRIQISGFGIFLFGEKDKGGYFMNLS